VPGCHSPRGRGARAGSSTPPCRSRPRGRPRNRRGDCRRGEGRGRNPGSGWLSVGTPSRAPRRSRSAPRHWQRPPSASHRPSSPHPGRLRASAPVPITAQPAGADIEGAHCAARLVDPLIVADRGTQDDQVAYYGGRRGELELAGPDQRLAGIDADRAILAEIGARLAVLEIERDQPEIGGRGQDPLGARPGRARGAVPDRTRRGS
jgi:hypothetical protein